MGIGLGLVYEWKSAWCSGLCPVHPVEKLYGENVLMTLPNAHCHECMNCVIPCPDSTPNIHPQSSKKTIWACMSGFLITGGLPGFIWGWFHVPDETSFTNISGFLDVYQLPFACMMVTLVLYGLLSRYFKGTNSRTPVSIFCGGRSVLLLLVQDTFFVRFWQFRSRRASYRLNAYFAGMEY